MQRCYVTVDVFTDRMFGGNPVAVVFDADGLSASQMQAIAVEFNYSETTFVLRASQPDHAARVRIFTPSSEIPFAGHPNVGTAFALAARMGEGGEAIPGHFVFEEEAGLVPVSLIRENGSIIGAELCAPEPLSRRGQVSPENAAACLSLNVGDIRTDVHQPQVLSVGLPFLIVELASRDALRRTAPNWAAYDQLLPLDGARSVYAYTRSQPDAGADIHARMFTPRMTEDPATGSAMGAAAALLAELTNTADHEMFFRFMQGVEMGRPSLLLARVLKDSGTTSAVYVGGRCVSVMQGSFYLPTA
jgi:trans-2,3-dihydro-3-hydroxyanthranilate isomerase